MPFKFTTGSSTKGTFAHFKLRRWGDLNKRTVNGSSPSKKIKIVRFYLDKGIKLKMTREEFFAWCDANKNIYDALILAGETPSIDRLNSSGDYEINNIRLISKKENDKKARQLRWDRYHNNK
jgi:hypothetical protein